MNTFTSEEMYVLAALMGRSFLIGVEGRSFENGNSDLEAMFRKNFSKLEQRGVFEYRINGTLFIDPELRTSFRVLNKAESVFVVVTDIRGYSEKVNFLQYKDYFCRLTEKSTTYTVESTEPFNQENILKSYLISLGSEKIKEIELPIDLLRQLSELYDSFDKAEADRLLSGTVQDTEIQTLISKCLLQKNGSFVMKEYKRIGSHLVNVNSMIMRFVDDYIIDFLGCGDSDVKLRIYQKEAV